MKVNPRGRLLQPHLGLSCVTKSLRKTNVSLESGLKKGQSGPFGGEEGRGAYPAFDDAFGGLGCLPKET